MTYMTMRMAAATTRAMMGRTRPVLMTISSIIQLQLLCHRGVHSVAGFVLTTDHQRRATASALIPSISSSSTIVIPPPSVVGKTWAAKRVRSGGEIYSSSTTSTPTAATSTAATDTFDWTTEWYPVAPIKDLDHDAPNKITLLGMDFCVWKSSVQHGGTDDEDVWNAFADSCPHRAVPLSEGRIERSAQKTSNNKGRGVLECAYHGWSFNETGACIRIPQLSPTDAILRQQQQQSDKNKNARSCVTSFPVRVEQDLLWIFPTANDPALTASKQPALIPEVDDPDTVDATAMYVRDLPYSVTTLIENLVDPVHVNHAHHSYMRGASRDNESHELDLTIVEDSSRGFRAQKDPPPMAPGRYDVKFQAPCLIHYDIVNSVALGHASEGDASKEEEEKKRKKSVLVLAQYCVPVGPQKCRLITRFPFYLEFKPAMWAMKYTPRWITHFSQNIVLDSDVVFLAAQDEKLEQRSPTTGTPKSYYMPSKSDAMVTAFHKWLYKYGGNQPTWIGIPATQSDGERMGWIRPQHVAARAGRDALLDRYRQHTDICSSCRGAHKRLHRLKTILNSAGVVLLAAAATPYLLVAKRARLVAAVSSVLMLLAPQFLIRPLITRLECAPWPRRRWLE